MFETDPLKDLERRIYRDLNQLKNEISINVKQYIDNRTQNIANPAAIMSEIQNQYLSQIKASVILETEQSIMRLVKEEVEKEI